MLNSEKRKRATTVPEMMGYLANLGTPESWQAGLAYQPNPSDVFIMTPAKCGTTWMQQIVHGLRTRGSMDFDEITQVVPWIEMAFDMGIDIQAPQAADPQAFKTHRTLNEAPQGGKYIIVVRDPKDALLSHYHFFNGWIFEKDSISIESFAREFYMPRRAYWNHIAAFWEQRTNDNILALCYEGIKSNLPETVEKVAQFIGVELDEELKEIVVAQSDIQFMREHHRKFDDHLVREARYEALGLPLAEHTSKVRNGQVGESKDGVPDEVKREMDAVWENEITPKLGLRSYDDLRRELIN